jgi:hypothetical protein
MEPHRGHGPQDGFDRGQRRWPLVMQLANLAVNTARLLRDLIDG